MCPTIILKKEIQELELIRNEYIVSKNFHQNTANNLDDQIRWKNNQIKELQHAVDLIENSPALQPVECTTTIVGDESCEEID